MKNLLAPGFQESFWASFSPDNTKILENFESKETWTFNYEDHPDLYEKIESLIPELQKSDNSKEASSDSIEKLTRIIADLPLRQSLSALYWIDKDIKEDHEIRWSSVIYINSHNMLEDHSLSGESRVRASLVRQRIELMVRLNILSDMFIEH